MIKHTPYIIEYPRFVDPRTTGAIQQQASSLLQYNPKNTTFHRKNRGYHLGEYRHVDGMQELNYKIDAIGKRAFMRYYRDCPLIAYSIIQKQGFVSNYVYRFYDKSDYYNWHVDRSHENLTFVVSFLLYLNDGFGGGDTLFLNDRLRIKPQNGSVLMFPCGPHFLHKSTKVTYGQKHVMWNCFGQRAPAPV
jgi:hypothetical protein